MRNHQCATLILAMMVLGSAGVAQSQKGDPASRKADVAPNAVTQPVAQPVVGGGTASQLTKWLGSSSTTNLIGDSTITEDKFLNVGIGTSTPTSKLN